VHRNLSDAWQKLPLVWRDGKKVNLPLFEIARVLVRFDHTGRIIYHPAIKNDSSAGLAF
jgi:hypothetical protein